MNQIPNLKHKVDYLDKMAQEVKSDIQILDLQGTESKNEIFKRTMSKITGTPQGSNSVCLNFGIWNLSGIWDL